MKKLFLLLFAVQFAWLGAAEPPVPATSPVSIEVPTVAVLPFEARNRGADAAGIGKSLAELVTISLQESGSAELVERAELEKALDELQLSAAGLVDPASRNKLGKLIGARILITGSMFKAGDKNYLVGKVIGTETSRTLGASVSGTGDYTGMAPELARKLAEIIEKNTAKLLPTPLNQPAVATLLAATVKGNRRKVFVNVSEEINAVIPDPAAETELKKLLLTLGFEVVSSRSDAEFSIIGEAIASHAGNYRQFVSAASRLELSIYGRYQNLLVTGACRETVAGTTYVIAAKDAIAQNALTLAQELFGVLK